LEGLSPGFLGYTLVHSLQLITRSYTVFEIESGVDMPKGRTVYPFADMLPGDSIRFATAKQANSARVSALRFVKTHEPDWQFALRKVNDEACWRLWRVA